MSFFNYHDLKQKDIKLNEKYDYLANHQLLTEASQFQLDSINRDETFDIFLSHSYQDREIIPYLKKELESLGYSVYVDWITDKLLNRDAISADTAEILQLRMKQSRSLFFATSTNSSSSKWMPWELGYFDGIKNKRVGILPVGKDKIISNDFEGQEYLGLYYYITINKLSRILEHEIMAMEKNALYEFKSQLDKKLDLFVNKNNRSFIPYQDWIKGKEPFSFDERGEQIIAEWKKNNE